MKTLDYIQHKLVLERLVIGLEEPILIKGVGQMMAKVDSGNDGFNVIHGQDCYQEGDVLVFTTYDINGDMRKVSKKIVDKVRIHIGSGVIEERPVVRLNIKFANEDYKEVPFSVADRGENKMKVLISKGFVCDELDALIDPSATGISTDGVEYEQITEGADWKGADKQFGTPGKEETQPKKSRTEKIGDFMNGAKRAWNNKVVDKWETAKTLGSWVNHIAGFFVDVDKLGVPTNYHLGKFELADDNEIKKVALRHLTERKEDWKNYVMSNHSEVRKIIDSNNIADYRFDPYKKRKDESVSESDFLSLLGDTISFKKLRASIQLLEANELAIANDDKPEEQKNEIVQKENETETKTEKPTAPKDEFSPKDTEEKPDSLKNFVKALQQLRSFFVEEKAPKTPDTTTLSKGGEVNIGIDDVPHLKILSEFLMKTFRAFENNEANEKGLLEFTKAIFQQNITSIYKKELDAFRKYASMDIFESFMDVFIHLIDALLWCIKQTEGGKKKIKDADTKNTEMNQDGNALQLGNSGEQKLLGKGEEQESPTDEEKAGEKTLEDIKKNGGFVVYGVFIKQREDQDFDGLLYETEFKQHIYVELPKYIEDREIKNPVEVAKAADRSIQKDVESYNTISMRSDRIRVVTVLATYKGGNPNEEADLSVIADASFVEFPAPVNSKPEKDKPKSTSRRTPKKRKVRPRPKK